MEASEIGSNLLYFNRIKVTGNWNRDLKFQNGINALLAVNERGKSTIVKLIFKTLCIVDDLDRESLQNIDRVYLEFKLNFKKYTVRHNYKNGFIHYVEDWQIDKFDLVNSKRIVQSKLYNLLERDLVLYGANTVNGQSQNSLRQCYRGFYLIQGTIKEIISKNIGIRKNVFRALLRSPEQSNNFTDLRNNIRRKKKQTEIQKKKKSRLLDSILTQITGELKKEGIKIKNPDEIKKISSLKEKYQKLIRKSLELKLKEKNEIYRKFKDLINLEKIFNDPEVLAFNEQIEGLNKKKGPIHQEIGILFGKSKEINTHLNKLAREIVNYNKQLEEKSYDFVLSEMNFEKCPRCNRLIDGEMKMREKTDHPTCLVCNRDLKLNKSIALSELLKLKKETEQESSKLLTELNVLKSNIDAKNQNLSENNERILKIAKKIEEKKRKLSKDHTQKLEKFEPSMGKIELEIKRYEGISQNIDDSINIITDLGFISKKLDDLKKEEKKKGEFDKLEKISLQFWENSLKEFMVNIFGTEIKSIDYFSFECRYSVNNSPKPNDNMKNMITLGYYYAFLKTSLRFSLKFPRIVFLDCVTTEELNDVKVQRIFNIFIDLKNKHKDKEFQIFFLTANSEIRNFSDDMNLIQPEEGEYLFNVRV
ncbi:hypothetical protein [Candidatus Lokiarchaeum ossiferum]|uniref:hypothetical protein n=1 Tax=Candidatus Lokiarchaeum ossiferum TaxID=2951803 RepID=UPI00352E4D92